MHFFEARCDGNGALLTSSSTNIGQGQRRVGKGDASTIVIVRSDAELFPGSTALWRGIVETEAV